MDGTRGGLLLLQLGRVAYRERLDGDGEHVASCGRGDLGGGGEAGTQILRRIGDGHNHFEVFGFFAGGGLLGGGYAGGADDGVVSDFRNRAVEDLVGNSIDGHFGGLADVHVDDVGFVH